MTVLLMSRAEIDRLHVLRDVIAKRISARDAAQVLRVTPRQNEQPVLSANRQDRSAGADQGEQSWPREFGQ